ncbi:MAG TPA: ATP-binding protein [Candidatus Dormibacteraeota bacterium]|jgi:signal transduction histidine kinase
MSQDGRADNRVNILVVDDNPGKVVAIRTILEPLGQNIVETHSGDDALQQLLTDDFAVILLDVVMPGMDGYETAEMIRGRQRSEVTPIIFLTAFDRGETQMTRGYGLGAVDFVFAPFVPEVLRAKVSIFVELHKKTEELKRVAERNGQLLQDAQEANRSKSAFLNVAAHELRTPLSVMRGYISMLLDGSLGPIQETWQQPMEIVDRKAEELNAVVNDLLFAARVDAGSIPAEITTVDLCHAAREAVERAVPRAHLLAAETACEAPADPVLVDVDENHLRRILDNLINNALTYNTGKPWVRVTVGVDPEPHIAVEDRGIGIPAREFDHVFERFYRGNDIAIGPQAGTGLGLYISRGLAERHRGSLHLRHSEPGVGSTFVLVLPWSEAGYRQQPGDFGG